MARRSKNKRWGNSKFAQFVQNFGVEKLANELGVDPSAIYHWMVLRYRPHALKVISINQIAKRRGVTLPVGEILRHSRDVESDSHKTAAVSPRSPQHARSL